MDLNRSPDAMVKSLYEDRPHQYHEVNSLAVPIYHLLLIYNIFRYYKDGLRFRTYMQLSEHTDKSLEKKKLMAKIGKQREYREWYCTLDQWVSDFNALNIKNKEVEETKQNTSNGQATEEFIMPADDNFVRCPFSNEEFEKYFDSEDGEYMYRNAVKVFVTENGNLLIFKQGKPVYDPESEEEIDGLRYLVVQKLLIMDRWIQEGKAGTLKEAIERYESYGKSASMLIEKLKSAAGEEDLEDIFVIFEHV